MKILSIDQIREKLEGLVLLQVAKDTKLHYNTVWRIARGKVTPTYLVLTILSDYLKRI